MSTDPYPNLTRSLYTMAYENGLGVSATAQLFYVKHLQGQFTEKMVNDVEEYLSRLTAEEFDEICNSEPAGDNLTLIELQTTHVLNVLFSFLCAN